MAVIHHVLVALQLQSVWWPIPLCLLCFSLFCVGEGRMMAGAQRGATLDTTSLAAIWGGWVCCLSMFSQASRSFVWFVVSFVFFFLAYISTCPCTYCMILKKADFHFTPINWNWINRIISVFDSLWFPFFVCDQEPPYDKLGACPGFRPKCRIPKGESPVNKREQTQIQYLQEKPEKLRTQQGGFTDTMILA